MADPLLKKQFPETELNQVMAIAAMCLQEEPSARPLIGDVVSAFSFLSASASSNENISVPISFPLIKSGKDDHESQVMEYSSDDNDEEEENSENETQHEVADSEEDSLKIVPESKWDVNIDSQKSISFPNQKWDMSSSADGDSFRHMGSMEHGIWDNSNRFNNSETHRFLDSDSSMGKSSRSRNGSFNSNADNASRGGGSGDDESVSSSGRGKHKSRRGGGGGKRGYSIRKLSKKFSRKSSISSSGSNRM